MSLHRSTFGYLGPTDAGLSFVLFQIMDYMVGGDLKSLLHLFGFLDTDVALIYTAEVVLALEHLHERGIIHR